MKIALILMIFLVACSPSAEDFVVEILPIPQEEPLIIPDGYRLLCCKEGKFTVCLQPDNRKSIHVWDTEKEAIEYAIYWEKINRSATDCESDRYSWETCNQEPPPGNGD